MKNQALFSSKDKIKKLKCRLLNLDKKAKTLMENKSMKTIF